MAKKTKKEPSSSATSTETATALASKPMGRPVGKRAAATKPVASKKASKKKPTLRSAKAANNQGSKASKNAEPSEADIRLRAYFVAERRVQLALQGDPAKDWLEAKQQLLQEARQKKS